jgi:hypothetical protein
VAKLISPVMVNDPNTTIQMVLIEIDGDSEENRNPQAQPDPNEFIEVISIPLENLLDTLQGTYIFNTRKLQVFATKLYH